MISEVVMPQMGADMTEGTVVRWLKHEGDAVERGEIIAEIETDKANVEIEAFESGDLPKALADEGDTVKVGEVIALLATLGRHLEVHGRGESPARCAASPAASHRQGARSREEAPLNAKPTRAGSRRRRRHHRRRCIARRCPAYAGSRRRTGNGRVHATPRWPGASPRTADIDLHEAGQRAGRPHSAAGCRGVRRRRFAGTIYRGAAASLSPHAHGVGQPAASPAQAGRQPRAE